MNSVFLGILVAYLVHAMLLHRHDGPTTEEETHLHRGMPAPLMPLTLFLTCQALGTPRVAAIVLSPVVWGAAALFVVLAFLNQLRKRRKEAAIVRPAAHVFYMLGGMFQTVLLVLACYIAFRDGVLGRSLFDPKWVILGLAAGHLVFGVSLVFSHRSLDSVRDILEYILDPRPVCRYAAGAPRQVFACLDVSIIEELIYRVTAQGALLALTGSPLVAVVVTAVVFSMVHRHFFYNHVVDSIEFLAFSLLLGALYLWTGSLTLVVLVHTVRNLEIVYFDQSQPSGDAGDSERGYHKGILSDAP